MDKGRKAFTLIELLVVVAILALLMSILLPSLSSARETAKSVYCANNLRTIASAIYNYGNDNKDIVLPWSVPDKASNPKSPYPEGDFWTNMLVRGKYASSPSADATSPRDIFSVFRCPTGTFGWLENWDDQGDPFNHRMETNFEWEYGSGTSHAGKPDLNNGVAVITWYTLNAGNNYPSTNLTDTPALLCQWKTTAAPKFSIYKLSTLRRASDLVLVFDGGAANAAYYPWRISGRHPQVSGDGRNGNCNIGFVDAHVKGYNTSLFNGTGTQLPAYNTSPPFFAPDRVPSSKK